jgi:hypothetical protein
LKKIIFISIIIGNVFFINAQEKEPITDLSISYLNQTEIDIIPINHINYKKVYRIWTLNEMIELIETENGNFQGRIINYVNKIDSKTKQFETITGIRKLSERKSKTIIKKIKRKNIDSIGDVNFLKKEQVMEPFLKVLFEIKNDNEVKYFLYSSCYYPLGIKYEYSPKLLTAEKIVKYLERKLKLDKKHSIFIDSLHPGNYKKGFYDSYEIK